MTTQGQDLRVGTADVAEAIRWGAEEARDREAAEARVEQLELALAACLRFAPGGIDDSPDRHGIAIDAWVHAWELIAGTAADWRRR